MKIIGKNSLVSVLRVLVNIALYLQYFGGIVLILLFVASAFSGPDREDNLILAVNLAENHSLPPMELDSPKYEQVTFLVRQGELHFMPDQHLMWWLIILVMGLCVVGYTILITLILKKLFLALEEGNFFSTDNAQRLRLLSILVVLMAPLEFLGVVITNFIISSHLQIEGMVLGADFNFMLLFTGLVLLVISELFKEGARLQEEYDYTV